MNKTYIAQKNTYHKWYILDARDQTLGRLSSKIAKTLKGKNLTTYTPHVNSGIYIILINSRWIEVTGKKKYQKMYKQHSSYPGGLKTRTFDEIRLKQPNKILERCIKGMLPKGKLGRQLFRQVKIYSDNEHPHEAQKPEIILLR
uniref:Large ribosomal subunit protein uL13c n=1 Tax=Melanthalia intermedia TaxID=172989 RepID=A0A345UAX0_9FLOR|nr:ribosomal protein L13 [Melanthalia intermedia]AXI97606.1 ribosomal protein L13 [Melanthalia intermedia]